MNDKFAKSELLPIAAQMEAYNRLKEALLTNFLEEMDEDVIEERLFQSLAGTSYDQYYQDWHREQIAVPYSLS